MSKVNSKTYVLIDYVNNLYAFVNSPQDILDYYASLGGIITGCSSTGNHVTCNSTASLIPNLTVIKLSGGGVLPNPTKVLNVIDSTHFDITWSLAVPLSGGVELIKVTNRGLGYTTPPTVTLSSPNLVGGIQATATATISSGYVSTVTVVNPGTNYTSAPTVTFSDPFIGYAWVPSGLATLNTKYYFVDPSGNKNWYKCTHAGTFSATSGPIHVTGTVDNGTTKLQYVGTTAKGESLFAGATLKAFMNISGFPVDVDGYLVDIFLVNIKTKKKVKIKFVSGNSLCI